MAHENRIRKARVGDTVFDSDGNDIGTIKEKEVSAYHGFVKIKYTNGKRETYDFHTRMTFLPDDDKPENDKGEK